MGHRCPKTPLNGVPSGNVQCKNTSCDFLSLGKLWNCKLKNFAVMQRLANVCFKPQNQACIYYPFGRHGLRQEKNQNVVMSHLKEYLHLKLNILSLFMFVSGGWGTFQDGLNSTSLQKRSCTCTCNSSVLAFILFVFIRLISNLFWSK